MRHPARPCRSLRAAPEGGWPPSRRCMRVRIVPAMSSRATLLAQLLPCASSVRPPRRRGGRPRRLRASSWRWLRSSASKRSRSDSASKRSRRNALTARAAHPSRWVCRGRSRRPAAHPSKWVRGRLTGSAAHPSQWVRARLTGSAAPPSQWAVLGSLTGPAAHPTRHHHDNPSIVSRHTARLTPSAPCQAAQGQPDQALGACSCRHMMAALRPIYVVAVE